MILNSFKQIKCDSDLLFQNYMYTFLNWYNGSEILLLLTNMPLYLSLLKIVNSN